MEIRPDAALESLIASLSTLTEPSMTTFLPDGRRAVLACNVLLFFTSITHAEQYLYWTSPAFNENSGIFRT